MAIRFCPTCGGELPDDPNVAPEEHRPHDHSHLGLVDHLEDQLGEIETAWMFDPPEGCHRYQVVRFGHGPTEGSITFTTLGLSTTRLIDPWSGRAVRHELLMTVPASLRERNVPGIMQQVASMALEERRPFLPGDHIGPRGRMFDDSPMEAFYITSPVYFPGSFAFYDCPCLGRIHLLWLIPITARESHYVRDRGADAFENLLAEHDPDLVDEYREEIPL